MEESVFHKRPKIDADHTAKLHSAEAALHERGLMARRLAEQCLEREQARSRRLGSPLTIAVLTPTICSSDETPAVHASAMTLKELVRTTDLLAWLNDDSILVILPDTSVRDARVAVQRWCTEMWRRSMSVGAMKWTSVIVGDVQNFEDADAVVGGATRLATMP